MHQRPLFLLLQLRRRAPPLTALAYSSSAAGAFPSASSGSALSKACEGCAFARMTRKVRTAAPQSAAVPMPCRCMRPRR